MKKAVILSIFYFVVLLLSSVPAISALIAENDILRAGYSFLVPEPSTTLMLLGGGLVGLLGYRRWKRMT